MSDPKSPLPPANGAPAAPKLEARRRRKLSAIMMADVSGFSRMMGKNEDDTVDLIKEFHQTVNQLVQEFEGRVVDTAGDSVFGEFDSVVNAVRCACRIQEEQAALNARRSVEQRIETRIGVHLGDVIVEDYHVYGDGVNIAARLEPMADPGGICMSEAVYQQIRNKLDLSMQDGGLKELKNIEHPIRIYRVAAPASVQASRADAAATPVATATRPSPAADLPEPAGGARLAEWSELLHGSSLVLLIVGGVLLLSPALLFPTGGVFPTGGAIVLSVAFGRLSARRSGRAGNMLIALGIGLASGAVWTHWSRVTNAGFVLAGLLVAASGLSAKTRVERRRLRHERRRLSHESRKLGAGS